ncbi:AraC-binding-like domain-containing protein [Promicromonospora thailandica]|uniref:AraC-binding-like domain-containing protein n=1 Tax=Promicromonospora thailandica TaxID=765201 RepID=A0A9X2GET2_9MICO|nr:AraC-binding-like domain-containing protein [Promicromonospora thailandica]BFF17475.1 hypothetical protein GCM10025730_09960 [Promicromonospora thailandica]
MDDTAGTTPWQVGGTTAPVVDIVVANADESRNRVLLDEWRRQAGGSLQVPPLSLPRHSEGAYRVRIHAGHVLGFPLEHQYSDAIAGRTGGPGGHHGDLIVVHAVLSGEWRFTSGSRHARARAGTVCVRRNDEPWVMETGRGTRAVAVGLPVDAIRFPSGGPAVVVEQRSPAARLLLAQLRLLTQVADDLGPAAAVAARNATIELFQGLVNDQVVDDAELVPALVEAAKEYIETRLLTEPDLSARTSPASSTCPCARSTVRSPRGLRRRSWRTSVNDASTAPAWTCPAHA